MQRQKMHMSRKQFRIGDLAKELKVKKFVIRFWEKEFGIHSDRSQGGQRFYTSEDLKTFLHIKDLLYNQGFTIAGAKKQLQEMRTKGTPLPEPAAEAPQVHEQKITAAHMAPPETIGGATAVLPEAEEADDAEDEDDGIVDAMMHVEKADSDAIRHQHPTHEQERLTPATIMPCSCATMIEGLKPIKEQLEQLKERLERMPLMK